MWLGRKFQTGVSELKIVAGAAFVLVLLGVSSLFIEDAPNERIARLKKLTVPDNGAELFAFMLREIPEVVKEIPCSCCSEVLAGCYQGACPPS